MGGANQLPHTFLTEVTEVNIKSNKIPVNPPDDDDVDDNNYYCYEGTETRIYKVDTSHFSICTEQ